MEDSSPVPIRKQVGASAHHLPAPSTYCSKEPNPSFPSALPSSRVPLQSSVQIQRMLHYQAQLANSLSSLMKTPAISLTSAQKRRIRRRKRLLASAPDQSREMAPAPDQSRCSQWGLLFQCPARRGILFPRQTQRGLLFLRVVQGGPQIPSPALFRLLHLRRSHLALLSPLILSSSPSPPPERPPVSAPPEPILACRSLIPPRRPILHGLPNGRHLHGSPNCRCLFGSQTRSGDLPHLSPVPALHQPPSLPVGTVTAWDVSFK